ncbi:LysE family translocator [Ralstonia sp. UBA689]|uniref:LysE family translocator n=1 Tax=Ralstonia sp. UBA689 TaxID=1947373 RepID=UPI0025E4C61A|nr:LysE family translocator [Ralstonia sp. UBA689]
MTWTNIWFFVIPYLIASALPGPAQGSMVAHVIARGRASALSFVVGMVSGNAIWLVATILGLATLALRFASVFVVVKWLGVLYLLFVAWKLWTSDPASGESRETRSKGFLAGALLTLGNPKAVVFFGAVLPQAFDLSALSMTEALCIVAMGVVIDLSMQSFYLVAALKARKLITAPRHMRLVNRAAAALIGGCALLIAKRA